METKSEAPEEVTEYYPHEAARLLQLPMKLVRRFLASGELRSRKVDGTRMIPIADLGDFANASRARSANIMAALQKKWGCELPPDFSHAAHVIITRLAICYNRDSVEANRLMKEMGMPTKVRECIRGIARKLSEQGEVYSAFESAKQAVLALEKSHGR